MKEVFGNIYSLRIMLLSATKYTQSIHIIRKGGEAERCEYNHSSDLGTMWGRLAVFGQAPLLVSYIRAGTAQTQLLPPKRN